MTPRTGQLVADRFLVLEAGWLDLASGEVGRARVDDEPPDGAWLERHATLFGHPRTAGLVDYGALGTSARFAVFRPPGARRLRPNATPRARGRSVRRPAALDRIVEFLGSRTTGPAWLQLHPTGGGDVSGLWWMLAREVRVHGFVPLGCALWTRGLPPERIDHVIASLAGRSVVVLSDRWAGDPGGRRQAAREAAVVLALGAAGPCAQLAVVSAGVRNRGWPWVDVERLPRAPTVAAARRRSRDATMRPLRSAAVTPEPGAHGSTGRRSYARWEHAAVREHAADFRHGGPPDAEVARSAAGRADLAGWRRLVQARTLRERGRHAAAARGFRDAAGVFERRGDQLDAATAWYELGRLRRTRGALVDARAAFEQAGRRFRAARAGARAIAAAAYEGAVRMEAGEFKAAEHILRAADLAAVQIDAAGERTLARAFLLQCLEHRARFEEAAGLASWTPVRPATAACEEGPGRPVTAGRAAEPAGTFDVDTSPLVLWHVAAGELALRRRSLEPAAAHMAAALELCAERASPEACAARRLAVRFHAVTGDVEAVRWHADRGRQAARAARAPIDLLALRVAVVEAWLRLDRLPDARAEATRLLRHSRAVRSLHDAERALVAARALPESRMARARAAAATAFAREHRIERLLDQTAERHELPAPVPDLVALLQTAHAYEDERDLLSELAGRLKSRLRALSVAIVSVGDPRTPRVAAGSYVGTLSARAIDAGVVLGPLRTAAGIELAAPTRCGGTCVGAVAVRWTVSGPDRPDHARGLVVTAAAMAGPFLKALVEDGPAGNDSEACPELLGVGQTMADVRRAVARAAAAPFPVLITGESGVGKELVARAIHERGPRRLRRFVALNCAALTDDLVETELFGHARGAFTGAVAERRGIFEDADGGTVFLDEVGELSGRAQAKLLRVLQEQEVRRVGETFARPIDVRVVAASNRPLDASEGIVRFRQDLRYRLDVLRIDVPPLRGRVEDIPVLAAAFWARSARMTGTRARLGRELVAALAQYDWPGNVRELQNTMAALAVAAPRHGVVGRRHLPESLGRSVSPLRGLRLDAARLAFERQFIDATLARAGRRTARAARDLGISRQGLVKMMKRLGLK